MSHLRGAVVVSLAVLSVLGPAGCRAGERVAAPAVTTSTPVARSAPSGTAASADPLADVEASVDAVARDLDADAAPDGGR